MSTTTEKVRAHLVKHGSIDELEAAVHYGCFSLSRVISRLRDGGLNITHERVSRKVVLMGGVREIKPFGKYILGKSAPTYLSYVREDTFSVTPEDFKPVTLLTGSAVPSEALRVGRHLVLNARFDCPCCGKGIVVVVDEKAKTNEDQGDE